MIKRLIYVMMIGLLGCNSDDEVKSDDGELSSSLIGRFNEGQVFDQGRQRLWLITKTPKVRLSLMQMATL